MLTKDNIQTLEKQANLKELVTGDYLKDISHPNFKYIKDKCYNLETLDKAKLLIKSTGLFPATAEILSKHIGNVNTSVDFPTHELIKDYLTLNFATLSIGKTNGKFVVNYEPAENHFKQGDTDFILRRYRNDNNYYILLTSFNKGIINNNLYQSNSYLFGYDDINKLKEVPLITLDVTSHLESEVNTGLEKVFFKVEESILDNNKKSLIQKIEEVVYGIDRFSAILDSQYSQHGESIILMKGIDFGRKEKQKIIDDEGNLKGFLLNSPQKVFNSSNPGAGIEFINNQNPLITNIEGKIERDIEYISSLTGIPVDYLLGVNRVGSIGADSRQLLHGNFMKTITSIRKLFDKTVLEILNVLGKVDKKLNQPYVWDSVYVKTEKEQLEELTMVNSMKLLSKESMLMKLGYTQEEAKIELQKIEEETTNSEEASTPTN